MNKTPIEPSVLADMAIQHAEQLAAKDDATLYSLEHLQAGISYAAKLGVSMNQVLRHESRIRDVTTRS